MLSSPITLQFRKNQNPFTVRLTPITVDTAERMGLGLFINSSIITHYSRAITGKIYTSQSIDKKLNIQTLMLRGRFRNCEGGLALCEAKCPPRGVRGHVCLENFGLYIQFPAIWCNLRAKIEICAVAWIVHAPA